MKKVIVAEEKSRRDELNRKPYQKPQFYDFGEIVSNTGSLPAEIY